MQTYDRLDAAIYDSYSTGTSGDVAFYVEHSRMDGSPVLEIACGTGRILIPVAEAGVDVVGLDRAPAMLQVARTKVAALPKVVQARIHLVEGDMRSFNLDRRFSLIMMPYRSFMHMTTPQDQRKTLACIREHLCDDGRLVFNVFDLNIDLVAQLRLVPGAYSRRGEFQHPQTGRKVIMVATTQFDFDGQVVDEYMVFEELDETGQVVSRTYNPVKLRWSYRWEMQYLLESSGFRIEALYGDFNGGPFRAGGEQVWIACKA